MEINLSGNLYNQLQEVHQENSIKLRQILDLEDAQIKLQLAFDKLFEISEKVCDDYEGSINLQNKFWKIIQEVKPFYTNVSY